MLGTEVSEAKNSFRVVPRLTMRARMLVLGIETSCDETAASVVKNGMDILSNVISSSLKYHKKFGGVVPEIATRHHVENIDKVINRSLHGAGIEIRNIDALAVTDGPGLMGALLTGISCVKAMSYYLDKPLIAVDRRHSLNAGRHQ